MFSVEPQHMDQLLISVQRTDGLRCVVSVYEVDPSDTVLALYLNGLRIRVSASPDSVVIDSTQDLVVLPRSANEVEITHD